MFPKILIFEHICSQYKHICLSGANSSALFNFFRRLKCVPAIYPFIVLVVQNPMRSYRKLFAMSSQTGKSPMIALLDTATRKKLLTNMSTFQGFVFDVDGTLVDTMPLLHQSFNEALAHPSIGLAPIPLERYDTMAGSRPSWILAKLYREQKGEEQMAKEPPSEAMCREYTSLVVEGFHRNAHLAKPLQHVVDIAVAARQHNIPIAIATTGGRENTYAKLEAAGLRELFSNDVIASEEDLEEGRGKPFPDVFLLAARRINVEPAYCAAFEDTPNGIEAASRAGMHVFDVRPVEK